METSTWFRPGFSLLTVFLGALASANPLSQTSGQGVGFYAPDDASLPSRLASVAESVVMIRTLAADDETSWRRIDVTEGKGSAIKDKIHALKDSRFTEVEKSTLILQVEACEKKPHRIEQKYCPLLTDIRQSSGFIAGDETTLWVTASSLDSYMTFAERVQRVPKTRQLARGLTPPIFVFDQKGRLLFNSLLEKVHFQHLPEKSEVAEQRKSFFAEDSDAIGLKLPRKIAPPLEYSGLGLATAQRIYALGYPVCTGCSSQDLELPNPELVNDRAPAPNAPGGQLRVTSGFVLSPEGLAAFFDIAEGSLKLWNLRRLHFHSLDSAYGMYGGPIVNEFGEVVALLTSGQAKQVDGSLQVLSRSVIAEEFLESY